MTLTIRKRMIQHVPVLELVPDHKINEALPLVIYYHGWHTKKELALTAGKKIANKNIRVIIPDSMYHGERQIENNSKIPSFRFWSTIQYNLSEFSLILDFYKKRDIIQDNQIGVAGFSMGGMTTAGLLTHFPEIKAAAILMGSPNYKHFISRVKTYLINESTYPATVFDDVLSWTKAFDLNEQPEKIDGRPLYFWHGTKDEKLPYEATFAFFDQHKDTTYGNNMSFETGVGEPHILRIDIMNRTADFFEEHLITKTY